MKTAYAAESPYKVLIAPVVTEKSTTLSEGLGSGVPSYVFNVAPGATKPQIRKAIEDVFSVTVENVRVSNLKGKPRSLRHRTGGKRKGRKPTLRRAYVRLAEGDNIDFWNFEEAGS